MGQSRVFYSMSNDGLIPKAFGDLHPKYRTPYKANWLLFIFVGLFYLDTKSHTVLFSRMFSILSRTSIITRFNPHFFSSQSLHLS